MTFSWKGGELHLISFKYTRVHVWVHRSELARRGVLKHEFGCTWVETAQGALCRQVLQSRACEAEENFSAKCTKCIFDPNINEEVANRHGICQKVYAGEVLKDQILPKSE